MRFCDFVNDVEPEAEVPPSAIRRPWDRFSLSAVCAAMREGIKESWQDVPRNLSPIAHFNRNPLALIHWFHDNRVLAMENGIAHQVGNGLGDAIAIPMYGKVARRF